jgi:outer membrane protein OmpA-like peptidoglycan-associated protein
MRLAFTHKGLALVTAVMLSACSGTLDLTYESATLVSLADDDSDGVINARDLCADTPLGTKINNDGCAAQVFKIVTVDFKLLFENNSSLLNRDYYPELASFAEIFKQSKDVNVELEGHASAVGDDEYNLTLSHKRANSVMDILVNEFDVDANRLTAVAFGESKLAADGGNETELNLNRRVVAHIQVNKQEDFIRWHSYSKEILDLID